MKIEKRVLPHPARMITAGVLVFLAGALTADQYYWWAFLFLMIGAGLIFVNVATYISSDNYQKGFADGKKEGERARGLISPESDLLEGSYEVLASAPIGSVWLVALADINFYNGELRVYMMKENPPSVFRKERHADSGNSDPNVFVHVNVPIRKPA